MNKKTSTHQQQHLSTFGSKPEFFELIKFEIQIDDLHLHFRQMINN